VEYGKPEAFRTGGGTAANQRERYLMTLARDFDAATTN